MAKKIIVNNCWNCPYREENTGGEVPHYCRLQHSSMDDSGFPQYCPLENEATNEESKQNYIDNFLKALEKRQKAVQKRYKADGKDITVPEVVQSIREEAYNYFLSDSFRKATDKHIWLNITAGRMLFEERKPEKVIELIEMDYYDECPFNNYADTDKELIKMMRELTT